MKSKEKAYQLHLEGMSYGKIAKHLGIGKTTAFNFVKEAKLEFNNHSSTPIPNSTERHSDPNSERPEPIIKNVQNSKENLKPTLPVVVKKSPIKVFTGDELIKKEFDSLEFTGKFLELIGKPSRKFSAIIWGLPKGGKSNFALRFADYLQEYFGSVIYIAAEEGESVTLQEKFKQIGGSKVTIAETRNKGQINEFLKTKAFSFVFIDSINTADIDNEYLEFLKSENPEKSFIAIVQATKGGNFKGDQALTHNCDFIIKVVDGIAHHTGRFGVASEIEIFKEPLYEKNPAAKIPKEEPKPQLSLPQGLSSSSEELTPSTVIETEIAKPLETEPIYKKEFPLMPSRKLIPSNNYLQVIPTDPDVAKIQLFALVLFASIGYIQKNWPKIKKEMWE